MSLFKEVHYMDRQGEPHMRVKHCIHPGWARSLKWPRGGDTAAKGSAVGDLRGVKCTHLTLVSQAEVYVTSSSMYCLQQRLMSLIFLNQI